MSTAIHFYGKDGAYPHYAGSDISRTLINANKNGRENFDDLKDLTEVQLNALLSWDQQYADKYPFVGHLVSDFEEEPLEYTNIAENEEKKTAHDQFMM